MAMNPYQSRQQMAGNLLRQNVRHLPQAQTQPSSTQGQWNPSAVQARPPAQAPKPVPYPKVDTPVDNNMKQYAAMMLQNQLPQRAQVGMNVTQAGQPQMPYNAMQQGNMLQQMNAVKADQTYQAQPANRPSLIRRGVNA